VVETSSKLPRASSSSLSEAEDNEQDDDFDDDSDDEDRPLASRLGAPTSRSVPGKTKKVTGKRSHGGKQGGGGKKAKKVHTLPSDDDRKVNGKPNGATKGLNGQHKKVKDEKPDSAATDPQTTVRTAGAPGGARTEKISAVELRKGVIQIVPVENDGQPRSLVILTGLKTLFQKQLPKMPREYIARLVYDENSRGLAIIKQGYKVVGGICFRPFPHRGFAEIVFFATNSLDQEKVRRC
jgi:histone acetyltransferase